MDQLIAWFKAHFGMADLGDLLKSLTTALGSPWKYGIISAIVFFVFWLLKGKIMQAWADRARQQEDQNAVDDKNNVDNSVVDQGNQDKKDEDKADDFLNKT